MKRKIAVLLVSTMAATLVLSGCGSESGTEEVKETTEGEEEAGEAETEESGDDVITTEQMLASTGYDVTDYVKLPDDYMDMTIEVTTDYTVTDDDIQSYMEYYILPYYPLYDQIEKTTVEDGDIVNIDFLGTIDGEEFDGGSADDYNMLIGSGQFIDGFEDGLIGQDVGSTVTLDLTFPDDYYTEDLAGVDVTFDVTVNGIMEETVLDFDDLNDDYVADNFSDYGINTVDDLNEYVREILVSSYETSEEYEIQTLVLDNLQTESEYSYPEEMLTERYDAYIEEVQAGAEAADMDYEEYVFENTSYDDINEFEEDIYETLKAYLEQELVLEAIVEDQQITITRADFDDFVEEAVAYYGTYYGFSDAEGLYEYYGGEDYVMLSYAESVALSNVVNASTIIEPNGTTETGAEQAEEAEEAEEAVERTEEEAEE